MDVSGWLKLSDEQMGSKQKFWCRDGNEVLWLFKYPRHQHLEGEHWSEWIAAQIAARLGLPHAEVRLARYADQVGVVTRDFTDGRKRGELVHGNQLLLRRDPTYPAQQRLKVAQHTIPAIFEVLEQRNIGLPSGVTPIPGVVTAADMFIGYLLLDAVIGNTDRHHENWAILERSSHGGRIMELAPTFDHASCLGREVPDAKRIYRLGPGRPDQTISGYAARTKSRIFGTEDDPEPIHPADAFYLAAQRHPVAGRAWLALLRSIPLGDLQIFIGQVPNEVMSEPARRFSARLLELNVQRVLSKQV